MSWLHRFLLCCALAAPAIRSSQSHADGLIYRLPPDGAWVRYKLTEEGKFTISFPPGAKVPPGLKNVPRLPVKSVGSLELRSVGQGRSDGEPCRWIEMELNVEITGKMPHPATGELREMKQKRQIILKLLIPEKHLAAGSDPLAHVRKLYFKDGDAKPELVEDEKAKQYEIDRFRPLFPFAAVKIVKEFKRPFDTLDPKLGRLECEKHTFDSKYEGPLARGRRGWWSWQGKHEVWLNGKIPFGVASLKCTTKSHEWSGDKKRSPRGTVESTKHIVVSKIGVGAKSKLLELELEANENDTAR